MQLIRLINLDIREGFELEGEDNSLHAHLQQFLTLLTPNFIKRYFATVLKLLIFQVQREDLRISSYE